jgi:hypothetical protein
MFTKIYVAMSLNFYGLKFQLDVFNQLKNHQCRTLHQKAIRGKCGAIRGNFGNGWLPSEQNPPRTIITQMNATARPSPRQGTILTAINCAFEFYNTFFAAAR